MIKIRLQRVGRRNNPSFRIVVLPSTLGPKSNKNIEILGHLDRIRKTKKVKGERIKYWISQGAQVSNSLHNLLIDEKVLMGKKVNALPKKKPIAKEKEETKTEPKAETEETPKENSE